MDCFILIFYGEGCRYFLNSNIGTVNWTNILDIEKKYSCRKIAHQTFTILDMERQRYIKTEKNHTALV